MYDNLLTKHVHAEKRSDGFLLISICYPEKNLLYPELMQDLKKLILEGNEDELVDGLLLTGSGGFFCGGLDVAAIQAGGDPVDFARNLVDLLQIFPKLEKPIVASVNGPALASGASLVAACDYAVSTSSALIGTYEVSIGIWPMIAQVPLIKKLGVKAAMENIGAGEPFTAQRALELGLIQKISANTESLESDALAWLQRAKRAKQAVKLGRPSFYELSELSYSDALEKSFEKFVSMFDSEDRK